MVSMRITSLDLGESVSHISTDWQVATNILFRPEDIILESINDSINKTHIEFNEVLDPSVKYYARARLLLSTGYTMWGNIDIFTPKDINDIEIDSDIPTTVGPPVIVSDSPFNNHALSMFTLSATGFSVVGSAKHRTTSWFIEDIDGNLVWNSIEDDFNKTSIHINDIILDKNKIYRIKTIFHSTSDDHSQVATKTLVTANVRHIRLLTVLNMINPHEDLEIKLVPLVGTNNTEWEIYLLENGKSIKIWDTILNGGDVNRVTVPAHTLKEDSRYILKIKSNLSNEWIYHNFGSF